MAQVAIPESITREIFYHARNIPKDYHVVHIKDLNIEAIPEKGTYVVKPDYTFGKRGKNNLLGLNLSKHEVKEYILKQSKTTFNGIPLRQFLITPFIPHKDKDEWYISLTTSKESDILIFSKHGGVDIESYWDKTESCTIPLLSDGEKELKEFLTSLLSKDELGHILPFLSKLLSIFREYHFAFLEINPLIVWKDDIIPLDFKARIDDTALFSLQHTLDLYSLLQSIEKNDAKEEANITSLDAISGASLKMKLLNRNGRIWPMISGGGASILFFDALVAKGFAKEIGFYGEYSGNPSFVLTYEYALQILTLMLASKAKKKVLLIAGANANFTDIAITFKAIETVIREKKKEIKKQHITILVRRGGPNVDIAFKNLEQLEKDTGIEITKEGVEKSITHILEYIH